VCVRCS